MGGPEGRVHHGPSDIAEIEPETNNKQRTNTMEFAHTTETSPSTLKSRTTLGLLGGLTVFLLASPAQAQRPSFGGLIEQVQDMLVGEEPFQRVAFGDGDCAIGIDPTGQLTGLLEYDVVGFRLMGDGRSTGMRLLFGPTMDCRIEVQPEGIPGLILTDPRGIRILPPLQTPPLPPILNFGPTDDCQILADPSAGGLIFRDPKGFQFQNPAGPPIVTIPRGVVEFGPGCSIGIDPQLTGIVEKDPGGFRLLGGDAGQGAMLTFGPTDFCRILIDPEREALGLIFTDPRRFSFVSPAGAGEAQVDVDGTLFANEVVERSSRESKENIRPIDNALDAVKQLQGVRFDWKESTRKGGGSEIGFVAEDVAAVVSEAASYDAQNKIRGVKYGNIVALAVEGIKAQQQQLDAQQRLIEELQREIAALRDRK